ncbi:MAG: hypothetical protein M1832_002113 [Thelocarpon impressellum]|nr:MAG: hypothetical protein M1832_002113 [Thelocarpon impressellum]
MTHLSSSLTTHAAPQLNTASGPAAHVARGPLTLVSNLGEDEPYTIKCICGFQDDDGSTVFCEKCETWQHIECYYPSRKVPEVHNCGDCEPRPLDHKRATEKQKRRREQLDVGDRKPKRPPVKSHRKKPKDPTPTGTQANGLSPDDRHDASSARFDRNSETPRDQPPAKRPKTSHRPLISIGSHADQKSASHSSSDSHRRSRSQPQAPKSPTTSPTAREQPTNGYHHDLYSLEFMRLHREDPGDSPLKANLLSNINFTSTFSSWIHDSDALRKALNGKLPGHVFQRVDSAFDELEVPNITKRVKDDPSIDCFGQHPIWQYLTVDSAVLAGGLVGELKGEVGHLQDYWQDPSNRSSLRHPEPFVFFHPQLPIYIDTRREGTRCRYVRRSCRPNVKMRTLISGGVEYHFCLCATEDLKAGTEITIDWDPDPEVLSLLKRGLSEDEPSGVKAEPLSRTEHDFVSSWIRQVLANFGGCACENPQACTLAQFNRHRSGAPTDLQQRSSNGVRPKKVRKGKQQASPLSTGQATNSRAGSEGTGHRDPDDENDDSRSTSGSVRSRPRSRDLTPMTHFSSDVQTTATGAEISDREKRKIAALERTFEQIEQDGLHQAQRRKKRPSNGSALATPGVTSSVRPHKAPMHARRETDRTLQRQLGHPGTSTSQPTTPEIGYPPEHSNGGTSRGTSHSPVGEHHAPSPTRVAGQRTLKHEPNGLPAPRNARYQDSSMQTEVDRDAWYHEPEPTPKVQRKCFVPLTKRLLLRCHDFRVRFEEEKKQAAEATSDVAPDTVLPDTTEPPERPPPEPVLVSTAKVVTGPEVDMDKSPTEPKLDEVLSTPMDVDPPENTAPLAIQPIDPNVQKPRPPDPSSNGEAASAAPIKPPPAPHASNSSTPSAPMEARVRPNGVRPAELHVLLPPTSQVIAATPVTPSAAGPSPTTANSLTPSGVGLSHLSTSFSPAVVSVTQPSPVKKKLSLSDYSRRKKAETPTSATVAVSPNMISGTLKKEPSSLVEVTTATAASAANESAIVDSPAKEEPDPTGR